MSIAPSERDARRELISEFFIKKLARKGRLMIR
jgi:hypothetical protein